MSLYGPQATNYMIWPPTTSHSVLTASMSASLQLLKLKRAFVLVAPFPESSFSRFLQDLLPHFSSSLLMSPTQKGLP